MSTAQRKMRRHAEARATYDAYLIKELAPIIALEGGGGNARPVPARATVARVTDRVTNTIMAVTHLLPRTRGWEGRYAKEYNAARYRDNVHYSHWVSDYLMDLVHRGLPRSVLADAQHRARRAARADGHFIHYGDTWNIT